MTFEDPSDFVPAGVFNPGSSRFPDRLKVTPKRGKGCYVYSESGTEYIDYLLGSGPLVVGHAHPDVVDAVQRQMGRGSQFYVPTEQGYTLAKRIVDAVPCAEQLRFTSTGTEATYLALRLARAYTGRDRIVKFGGAYHGWHDEALVSSSHADSEQLLASEPPEGTVDSAGLRGDPSENVVIAPYNDLERTREIVGRVADDVAAMIVEPVMRSLPPIEGFLAGLEELCSEHDIVLIFDEVVTGFRMAWGGAQEYYGVEPDLATYGKAIGGGTPIAAVCGSAEILRLTAGSTSDHVTHAGTLNGNPLCAAAGNATLDVLETPGTYRELNRYASEFRDLIDDLLSDSSFAGQALGEGPVVDYVLTEERDVTAWTSLLLGDSETKRAIDEALLELGVLHHVGGKRYISTEHGDEELERTAELYKRAIERVDG